MDITRLSLLVAAALFVSADLCKAETVISTLGNAASGADGVTATYHYAGRFITSASPEGWTVTGASINILQVTDSSGNFLLSIFDNAIDNTPGSLIGSFTGPSDPSVGINSYTSAGIALDSEASYWLVASVTEGQGSYSWSYVEGGGDVTGIWSSPTTADFAFSYDFGSTWSNGNEAPYLYSIEAVAVPEPSTLALGAAGLASAAWGLYRRRKRA